MSADNWAICPRCTKQKNDSFKSEELKLQAAYGHVSSAEFIERTRVLADKRLEAFGDQQHELREDYEFQMDTAGKFIAEYRAHCKRCGFVFEFKHEETIRL